MSDTRIDRDLLLNGMDPLESQNAMPHKKYSSYLILLVMAVLILGGYFSYAQYQKRQNQIKIDQSTPEQGLRVLESLQKTPSAEILKEQTLSASKLPLDLAPFLLKNNPTVLVSGVTFDNKVQGYKIFYKYNGQNIDEVQNYWFEVAVPINKYDSVEALHNISKPAWVSIFENSKYLVKINILQRGDTTGDVFIIIMPKS